MTTKRITFTHRKGGRRTVDKDGNEIKEQKTDKDITTKKERKG